MLLGGAEAIQFVSADDWKTKAARNARDDARNSGKIPMLAHEEDPLKAMVKIAKPVLESFGAGDVEQTMIWRDGKAWGRARPDWLAADRKMIIDYKTATNADPAVWIRKVLNQSNYDLQAAWYLRGLEMLEGVAERDFLFLVQEIKPPYCCSVIGAGPDRINLSQRKIEAGVRIWTQCIESETWPGYDTRTHWADLPDYMLWNWEAREASTKGGE